MAAGTRCLSTDPQHNLIITFWVARSAQNNAELFSPAKTHTQKQREKPEERPGEIHFDFNLMLGQHNNIVSLYRKEPPQTRTHRRDRGGFV